MHRVGFGDGGSAAADVDSYAAGITGCHLHYSAGCSVSGVPAIGEQWKLAALSRAAVICGGVGVVDVGVGGAGNVAKMGAGELAGGDHYLHDCSRVGDAAAGD